MNDRLAVAGGTGLIGRLVVDAIRAAGREPVVVARSAGVDVLTGAGLDAALTGVDAVIDVVNVGTQRRRRAVDFFGTAAATLARAERRAGVRHHVALSIVGIDRVDTGYYAGKLRQEEVVTRGEVPWTILRATQFHEFAGQLLDLLPGPAAIVPNMLSRPVAAREVAEHLVALAGGPAIGRAPEIAGPEERRMADLVRRLARSRGSHRAVWELPALGTAATAAARGALLPSGPGPRGTETFEQWLARTRGPQLIRSEPAAGERR
ncbi:SDR family oxidoreductase [Nakamurella sp.]|uniref:SDR family oxidoreductase n=1 Tax=Nakamurella sp. TaxID=1869182 RepID=UPI003784AA90